VALIRIHTALREHCGGRSSVEVEGASLDQALRQLAIAYPDCGERILDASGAVREWVRIEHSGDLIDIVPNVCGG